MSSPEQPSFEHSLSQLETIVQALEDGELSLADALARYEQGIKHLQQCYRLLNEAEHKIELLTAVSDDGTPQTQPLAAEAAPLEESVGRRSTRKVPRPKQRLINDDDDMDG
ncbi:MAG: exodeoxyribonuclease VII small subunit [Pirellulaceae bacterium]|nr:exodeoxyribonuclease VII small subunit [Pirellulaceae bacterium]